MQKYYTDRNTGKSIRFTNNKNQYVVYSDKYLGHTDLERTINMHTSEQTEFRRYDLTTIDGIDLICISYYPPDELASEISDFRGHMDIFDSLGEKIHEYDIYDDPLDVSYIMDGLDDLGYKF
jgi:hypothetical protein